MKKVNLATSPILYTHSVTLNITSSAKFIYAIANCEDILTDSPSSTIGKLINQNMGSLKNFFDYILATSIDSLFEDSQLLLTGYTDEITQHGTDPYFYQATVNLKPLVSRFDIKVTSTIAPEDFIGTIQSIEAFVLNSRKSAKLFSPTSHNFPYVHGIYESFWVPYGNVNFQFSNENNVNTKLTASIPYTPSTSQINTTEVSIYPAENDTLNTLGSQHKTLVVLKVRYKMKTIEGVDEEFTRFLTVPLNPPTGSTLSNKRGTRYTINFTLSGKYFGAMSPLSSLMQPYSPLPSKSTKNLIYVAPEDYSTVKSSEWK